MNKNRVHSMRPTDDQHVGCWCYCLYHHRLVGWMIWSIWLPPAISTTTHQPNSHRQCSERTGTCRKNDTQKFAPQSVLDGKPRAECLGNASVWPHRCRCHHRQLTAVLVTSTERKQQLGERLSVVVEEKEVYEFEESVRTPSSTSRRGSAMLVDDDDFNHQLL